MSASARDAIIDEIKAAPESLVREAYDFILFLKRRTPASRPSTTCTNWKCAPPCGKKRAVAK